MGRFFARERFGRPQVLAGTLLLIFLAQCALLVNRSRSVMPEAHEIFRIHEGLGQWRGQWIASTPSVARTQQSVGDEPYDSHHSALWYLRSEEHTSELQSLRHLVCRLLLEKKK